MTEYPQLAQALCLAGAPARLQVPLAGYTTFRIGGPAKLFCTPTSQRALIEAIGLCRAAGCRYYLLGRGSNTLFADEGFDGAVIALGRGLDSLSLGQPGRVTAGCGSSLAALCGFAAKNGLSGLEFACGIPGSVGGAVYMNAGAYGGEIKDRLVQVRWLDDGGQLHTSPAEELGLGYRSSRFAAGGGVILSAEFALAPGEEGEIRGRMQELLCRRAQKQPLDLPSAGSAFKRPQGAYAAALIEECGLKGLRVGGAAISEKHSGFIVNLGGATAAQVLQLADQVARTVREKTGFVLEKEFKVVR